MQDPIHRERHSVRAQVGDGDHLPERAAFYSPARLAGAPGWTLHQLRHSALTRAAEGGANTGTLLAYSGHTSVASLAIYTRVSPDALGRWRAQRDPHRRR